MRRSDLQNVETPMALVEFTWRTLLLFLGFTAVAWAADSKAPGPAKPEATATYSIYSTAKLETTMGGHRLRIPTNYVDGGFGPEHIGLMTRWPEMDGRTAETNTREAAGANYGYQQPYKLIEIFLDPDYYSETANRLEQSIADRQVGEPRVLSIGLLEYPHISGEWDQAEWYRAKDQLVTTPSGKSVVLFCDWAKEVRDAPDAYHCQMQFKLREGLWIKYRFFKKHIADWQGIHTAIVNLVTSFIGDNG